MGTEEAHKHFQNWSVPYLIDLYLFSSSLILFGQRDFTVILD